MLQRADERILRRAIGAFVLTIASVSSARARVPVAFPGAEGFGAGSLGGRGGRVIEVTNLADDGPGSLRAAIEAQGPRIVVFRVGGTIELRSELVLSSPRITIAGQTAPGGGITLKTHPLNPRSALTIKKGAHDVVIRHLRIRPGPSSVRDRPDDDSHVKDALQILDASRVIIDHCSFSWATDEVVSTWYSARDVTIQWCLIAEALQNSARGGPHGKGLLIGSRGAERISVHHNLLVHNYGRNPMIKAEGVVDVVNNIVLAPGTIAGSVDGEYGRTPINFVGNYVLAPNGDRLIYGVQVLGQRPVALFVRDNLGPYRRKDDQPDDQFVKPANRARQLLAAGRHDAPHVTTTSPEDAWRQVVNDAGCTRPMRDAVDQRLIEDVREFRCRLVSDPMEVGGWPELPAGEPPKDIDRDGMPDEWERNHNFDPSNPADGPADADGDGFTNVEEFLNESDPAASD